MRRRGHLGSVALIHRASKMDRKSTHQPCPLCGETFRANPTQLRVWGGLCYECFGKRPIITVTLT